VVDRQLNYGPDKIKALLTESLPYGSVLDFGAGRGRDLGIAREVNPASRLIAIESYPPCVEALRKSGVEVHSKDLERDVFPFERESLDVVISNQVMEHVKEIFWILHQVATVLKVGGNLIIGVPNLASLHNRLLLLLGRQPTSMKNWSAHVRGFTYRDLVEVLDKGAPGVFKLKSVMGSNFYPFPPFLARPLAWLFPTLAWAVFIRIEKVAPYDGSFLRYPVESALETKFFLGSEA